MTNMADCPTCGNSPVKGAQAWLSANGERIARTLIHAGLMVGSIYIAHHSEWLAYAPAITYLAAAVDSAR